MKDFNGVILQSYRRKGYFFLQFKVLGFFGIVTPLFDDEIVDDGAYAFPIDDERADNMARGLNDIEIYVLEHNRNFHT
jgi:hypothetical protein